MKCLVWTSPRAWLSSELSPLARVRGLSLALLVLVCTAGPEALHAQGVESIDAGSSPNRLSSPLDASTTGDAGAPGADAVVPTGEPVPSEVQPTSLATGVPPAEPKIADVEVRGGGSSGRRLASSSAAVRVIDVQRAQREAADLGAVLAREAGVRVQRAGGLGAQTRISLQGLGEDQIRFYVDGIPLAFSGLPESIAFVPTDLVSRVEAYRGVVPIRFGGDTLGGAMHLVPPPLVAGTHGTASLTLAEFGTQRVALRAQHLAASGLFAHAQLFVDRARNDYAMRGIPVAQRDGTTALRRVHRLHDAYRGGFGQLEVGVVDRPFAKKLSLRAFASGYQKEINHDVSMNTVYGEVLSLRRSAGATLAYDVRPSRRFALESRLGYAQRTRTLRDFGKCAYDWYRNCVATLPNGGEIFGQPADRRTREHDLFLRMQLSYRRGPYAQLRASVAPTYVRSRARDEAAPAALPDLFAQKRELFGLVLGVEHELDAFAGALENVLFAKDYLQRLAGEATTTAGRVSLERGHHRLGIGNATRVRLHESLLAKASYELGARMPDAAEVFGDGVFVDPNLRLRPERSHNLNLELRYEERHERYGVLALTASGFLRRVDDFIFLLPSVMLAQYQNLARARVRGVEGTGHYATAGEHLSLDANVTYQDMRNRAERGPFAMFEGARVPNRPFLFGNLSVSGRLPGVVYAGDALTLTLRGSYVGKFYRAFEVRGASERDVVPRQLVSSLVLTYELTAGERGASLSLELDNLTDARVYDFFGVQRPGRYALAKWTLRL